MDLHHGNASYEPPCDNPEAIRKSGPYFVQMLTRESTARLVTLYAQFGPYLSDEDIRDIAAEAYRRVLTEVMGELAEAREGWEGDGTWWEAWQDPYEEGS